MTEREQKFYRIATYIFAAVLLCHILLASFLIFNPNKNYLTDSRFEKAYRLFGLTGPFFSEDRINVVPHVYASVKKQNDEWSEVIELGKKEFGQYHNNYFDYSSFTISGLPKYLCRELHIHSDSVAADTQLTFIKNFFVHTNPEVEIDSVTLIYTLESLLNEKTDTLFKKQIGGFERYYQ
jgi:hypothetical protein